MQNRAGNIGHSEDQRVSNPLRLCNFASINTGSFLRF